MSNLEAVPVERMRLTDTQMAALRKKLGPLAGTIVNGGTTPHEAGFKLGIQTVLEVLREGWGQ